MVKRKRDSGSYRVYSGNAMVSGHYQLSRAIMVCNTIVGSVVRDRAGSTLHVSTAIAGAPTSTRLKTPNVKAAKALAIDSIGVIGDVLLPSVS